MSLNDSTNNHPSDANLHRYGWNDKLDQLKQASPYADLPHGRIAIVHRTCYEVVSSHGVFQCELAGRMLIEKSADEQPCTGDWIIFQPFDNGKGIVVDMLPRARTLYRKKNGSRTTKQAIASYVDKAFVVQSLDGNFNPRRAERFMVQIREADIQPVLVLHKAELEFDQAHVLQAIAHLERQMPILRTSIHQPDSINRLRESIQPGETAVFVGSSGVGKSSLINALCKSQRVRTSETSHSTGKGRHTSTRRELVEMDGAGILIDTPGVREFGLATDAPDTVDGVLDIADFAQSCRFADCSHQQEPGCAVREALDQGLLSTQVYESYHKLQREIRHYTASEHEKRRQKKSLTKLVHDVKKRKDMGR